MVVNKLRKRGVAIGSVEMLMTSTSLRDFASKLSLPSMGDKTRPKSGPPTVCSRSAALPAWLAGTLQLFGIFFTMTILIAVPYEVVSVLGAYLTSLALPSWAQTPFSILTYGAGFISMLLTLIATKWCVVGRLRWFRGP